MKQKTRWHDALVLAAVLCAAFLIVTGTQQITGRIDGVASMVFVLAVFLISVYTDGYVWGVVASLIGVLAVNFAFRSPYFAFNFTLPENLFSGMAMLVVSIMTSTLTTRIKAGTAADGERDRKDAGHPAAGRLPRSAHAPYFHLRGLFHGH